MSAVGRGRASAQRRPRGGPVASAPTGAPGSRRAMARTARRLRPTRAAARAGAPPPAVRSAARTRGAGVAATRRRRGLSPPGTAASGVRRLAPASAALSVATDPLRDIRDERVPDGPHRTVAGPASAQPTVAGRPCRLNPASRRPRPNAWQSQTARLMIPAGERWREQVVAGAVVRPAPTAPAPSGYGDNARAADDPGREVAAGWVTGSGVTRPAWSGSAGQAGGRPLGDALPRGWARARSDLGVPTSKRPGSSQ
jgi:hypothetical protein